MGPAPESWAWKLERLAESEFSMSHVIACSSGTMALMAAIHAIGLEPGGEIVTTPFTFSATAAAIRFMGHEPVFADVDPVTFCLDPAQAATVVGPRTRALLPVDLFGQMADYDALWRLGLPLIEDACQAVGAQRKNQSYRDEPLWGGRGGTVGVWSFNGAKQVPAGEGGAVVTNDDEVADRARAFISHGENWSRPQIGINGRINEPTALLAYHGLREVKRRNLERRDLAQALVEPLRTDNRIAVLPDPDWHALYVFPLVLAKGVDRARFVGHLRLQGIEAGEGYLTPPIYRYEAFQACRRTAMPVVDELSERTLVLLSQVRPPATLTEMDWLAAQIIGALDQA